MGVRSALPPALAGLMVLLLEPATGIAASQVRLQPAAGAPRTVVTLDGNGFPASRRVRVGVAGQRSRALRTNGVGAYRARVTIPARRRGWVSIVSRSGGARVVSRYFVGTPPATGQAVEFAARRGRLRLSTGLLPGTRLTIRGQGLPAHRRLRLGWAGARLTLTPNRRGRFTTVIGVPPTLGPGTWAGRLEGRGVRLAFWLDVLSPPPRAAPPPPPPPPPPAPAPPPGLVALWHMDEPGGSTVMHDAVGGHDGTLHSVTAGVPGFAGTAFGFSHSFVSVPSAPALNPGARTITLTIRMRTTFRATAPDWDLIRKGVATDVGGDYKVEYYPSGQASCGFIDASGSANELIAGPVLNDGAWHTVRCTLSPSAIVLVIDGQPFSKPARIGSISNSADLVIGAHDGVAEFFQGALDEAMVQVQ